MVRRRVNEPADARVPNEEITRPVTDMGKVEGSCRVPCGR